VEVAATVHDGSDSMDATTKADVRWAGWKRFRFVVAAVLLTAAVVKIFTIPEIIAGRGLLATQPRLVSVIGFEAAVATFLIIGHRFWSWLLALSTFAIFVGSALYALSTDQACNCFGAMVDPEAMVIVDVAVLLLTAFSRPRDGQLTTDGMFRHLVVAGALGGVLATLAAFQYQALLRNEDSRIMLPEARIGKPWPLTAEMHPKLRALETGRWMVLIVKQDCPHCRDLITELFSDPAAHPPGERTAVFVFTDGNDEWQFQFDRVAHDLSGSDLVRWTQGPPLVSVPVVFAVVDGVVEDAAVGDEADSLIRSALEQKQAKFPVSPAEGSPVRLGWRPRSFRLFNRKIEYSGQAFQ